MSTYVEGYPRGEDPASILRRTQVHRLVGEAWDIAREACEEHIWSEGKRLAGECVLYSGGDDSTVLAHIFKGSADFAVHINTTVFVCDDNRGSKAEQFVRETCAEWDLPLLVESGDSYRDLVIAHGFPGPAHHYKMYQRLKERGLRKVRRRLVENPRRERVLFIAGRRRSESERRANVPKHERDGSVVWASPLVNWTKADLMHPDLRRNPVSANLHMSGECMCGAFAKPDEMAMLEMLEPATAVMLHDLEAEVRAAGHPPERCVWGWGAHRRPTKTEKAALGPLCQQCSLWTDDETPVAVGPEIGSTQGSSGSGESKSAAGSGEKESNE